MITREKMKEALEAQIVEDAQNGDTTVLAEILSLLSDDELYNALSDENQKKVDQ